MSDAVEEADCALLVRLSSGQFITIPALDNELIWHVKIKLSKVLFIQPEKQMLFLLGESKELEVCFFNLIFSFMNETKRDLLI